MKIIVIDDEIAALNTFLPNIIDNLDIECKMFMSAPNSAIEYCRKNRVDAAFLDIVMPQVNGVDLAEKLISVRPDIKIIFISAYAQNEDEISSRLGKNFAGFCYKPYEKNKIISVISSLYKEAQKPKLFLRTFDAFDLFVGGVAVDFSSRKAKELLALLTDARGSYVTMDTAICNLWADKNVEFGKRLYRDAVCRLRMTLKEAGAEELVTFERGRAVINTQTAECDMWTYVEEGGVFSGRYMPQYDWSIITESALQQRKN